MVRYADDLVALHADLEVITKTQQLISNWLHDMGLELKPSKTRITHTLYPHEGNLGFNFLGFHVRQYQVGKTHSAKNPQGDILGFKTIIKPSDEAIQRHDQSIRTTIRKLQNAPQAALIKQLNPIIRGWTNYYSPVASKRTFAKLVSSDVPETTPLGKTPPYKLVRQKSCPKILATGKRSLGLCN